MQPTLYLMFLFVFLGSFGLALLAWRFYSMVRPVRQFRLFPVALTRPRFLRIQYKVIALILGAILTLPAVASFFLSSVSVASQGFVTLIVDALRILPAPRLFACTLIGCGLISVGTVAPSPRHGASKRLANGRGFTLLELLVAMCIISVLLGLTFPVLQRTRDLALKNVCMSNLREIRHLLFLYLEENENMLPPIQVFVTGFNKDGTSMADMLGAGRGIFRCPAAEGRKDIGYVPNVSLWRQDGSSTLLIPDGGRVPLLVDGYFQSEGSEGQEYLRSVIAHRHEDERGPLANVLSADLTKAPTSEPVKTLRYLEEPIVQIKRDSMSGKVIGMRIGSTEEIRRKETK